MLWTIIIILLALWFAGFIFKIAGKFIHALLIIALVVIIFGLLF